MERGGAIEVISRVVFMGYTHTHVQIIYPPTSPASGVIYPDGEFNKWLIELHIWYQLPTKSTINLCAKPDRNPLNK